MIRGSAAPPWDAAPYHTIYLSIYLSIDPSIYLSVYLSIYLSIYLSLSYSYESIQYFLLFASVLSYFPFLSSNFSPSSLIPSSFSRSFLQHDCNNCLTDASLLSSSQPPKNAGLTMNK